jgi:hypothetical protein
VLGTFPGSGGTVTRRLPGGQVTLTSWIPAQGYGVDGYSRGPAPSIWVKFKSGGTEQTITVTCVGGRPHFTTAADDHGGGGGGGGGDSGGSGRGGSGH